MTKVYHKWDYRQLDSNHYIKMKDLADGEILEGVVGPSLKIASILTADKVDKIHALALIYRGKALSNPKFITHHDSVTALYAYLGANPLYARIQEYILGFSTLDDWFLDPWQAFRIAQDKKQIHKSCYSDDKLPLYPNQVLFFNKNK